MSSPRIPNAHSWFIVTFKEPVTFNRVKEEAWVLNPVRRYVFNAGHLPELVDFIDTLSDLKSSSHHRALQAGAPIAGAKILVERYRDRGIGDLLFLTGPMAYLNHITGGDVKIDIYAFADRGQIFLHNPLVRFRTVLVGPTHYDDLPHYNYHWFVDSGTEHDEEPDQLNVYDALYKQLGIDPQIVDGRFKRPSLALHHDEMRGLDRFFYLTWMNRKIDLRATGYYVAAPFTHSALRVMNYGQWVDVIREAAKRRPVLVVGHMHDRLPDTDISPGEFVTQIETLGPTVINAINATPLRVLTALISKANCLISLDSGVLYIAQALRIPAISLWGPHDPAVRLGYDPDYMDLAIWKPDFCNFSPCFAYAKFPHNKCPRGEAQTVCEVFSGIQPQDVLEKLDKIEARQFNLGRFQAKQNEPKILAAQA